MTDTHAQIVGKGLDGTGITEDMADDLFNRVGAHLTAVVDLQVIDKAGPNLKGKRKVSLAITSIEPAVDPDLAEHLRELARAAYSVRTRAGAQRAIDDELDSEEPTVAGVMAAGRAHCPHPFIPVDVTLDNPICDVCGELEPAPRHSVQDLLPEEEDEDQDELEDDEHQDLDPDQDDDEPSLDTTRPAFSSIPGGAA